jgi:phage-related protein (TIGR01555 family)
MMTGGAEAVQQRAELFNVTADNRGLMLLDKETEEFFNLSTPLGSLDKLQAQAQEQMASVAGIPLVKLLGITPSGLNASTDGEIRVFYDTIHAAQEHLFGEHLKTVLDIIQISEFGSVDDDIIPEFEPLWQLDDAGKSAVQKTIADTHEIYMNAGVVDNTEVREQLAADTESPYAGLDLSGEAPGIPIDPNAQDPNDPESNVTEKGGEAGSTSGANSGV